MRPVSKLGGTESSGGDSLEVRAGAGRGCQHILLILAVVPILQPAVSIASLVYGVGDSVD